MTGMSMLMLWFNLSMWGKCWEHATFSLGLVETCNSNEMLYNQKFLMRHGFYIDAAMNLSKKSCILSI